MVRGYVDMKKEGSRIKGMDGLRGIAIIGITLFHMFPNVFKGGYLGVVLFFVLTGFLMVITNKKKMENKEFSVIKFYVSRIKRLYPPLLVMVFTTLGIYFFLANDSLRGMKMQVLSIFAGFNNFWQISQSLDYFTRIANTSPFSHLWFLSIEMQFYLIFPLLLFGLYKLEEKKRKVEYNQDNAWSHCCFCVNNANSIFMWSECYKIVLRNRYTSLFVICRNAFGLDIY